MCGRFAFYSPHEAVTRLFGVAVAPEIEPRYNIAPTQFIATVRDTGGPREVALLYWGLVPSWAKDKAIGARMINARAETLTEKPSFRGAFRRRRCLVLADGYYEWQRSGTVKQPYFIAFDSGAPFGMAGLWERWRDPMSGEPLESCCIVTTSPAPAVAHVHDRMPVIVPRDAYAEWLDPRNEATDRLARLLRPTADPGLQARPVSRRVNDARNQGVDLIEPVGTAGDAP
jgi:putative SOS response-associated peptidase YedK